MNNNLNKIDFRNSFFDRMYEIAKTNESLVFLTADISAHSIGKFRKNFPNRFYNLGISEQNMITVASGLAMNNKIVFAYSMIPFITMRCFEHIKVDISSMNLPITLIGLGSGLSYNNDGPSAHGIIDIGLIRLLPNITILNPSDPISCAKFADIAFKNQSPTYVRLDKSQQLVIYGENEKFDQGFYFFDRGNTICIISTGIMVHKALELSNYLNSISIKTSVIDLYKLKPIDKSNLIKTISKFEFISILEENSSIGGLGSIISELLTDYNIVIPLKKFNLGDLHCFDYASREWLHKKYKIDNETIINTLKDWIK